MTNDTDTTDDNMLNKIRALLAKAEGTDNAHEAEVFSAKAFALMDKHRIAEARVRELMGVPDEVIGGEMFPLFHQKYLRASLQLLMAVAIHNGVVVVVQSTGNSKTPKLYGTPTDIANMKMMFGSLIIQRDRACVKSKIPMGVATAKHRNSFCYGFAYSVHGRLKALRDEQRAAATANGTTDSVALAVIDKYDQTLAYLQSGALVSARKSSRSNPNLNQQSAGAGIDAGNRADLGGARLNSQGQRAQALNA